LATAATGSSAPSPGSGCEEASFAGGNTGAGVGAGSLVAGGAVASGAVVGASEATAAAIGVVTDSDDTTDRPKKNPPAATATASITARAIRPARRRDLLAGGGVGLDGRPTMGGSDGHCGLSAAPAPETGVVMKLRSANEGPGRAATGGAAARGPTGRIWLGAGREGPAGDGGLGSVGICGAFCVMSGTIGTRLVGAAANGAEADAPERGTSTRGISTGCVAAGVDRSQIGGFGRSGSEPVDEGVGGCSTVVNLWVAGERICKAERKFC